MQSEAKKEWSSSRLGDMNSRHSDNAVQTPNFENYASLRDTYLLNDRSLFGYVVLNNSLIVNYLPVEITDQQLFRLFLPYGPIRTVKLMKEEQSGYFYGYGFVNFHNETDAYKAIRYMDGRMIGNKRLKVNVARKSCDEIKHTNIYINHLPRHMSDEEFMNLFLPFGKIINYRILRDRNTNLPIGGFIRYDRREQASDAVHEMNNKLLPGTTRNIHVVLADDHGKQKAAYMAGVQDALNRRTPVSANMPIRSNVRHFKVIS